MANVGLTALILLPIRLAADATSLSLGKGSVRDLLRQTTASAVLLGIAAVLAVFFDPALHHHFAIAFGLASLGFRLACAWAVVKSLYHHPLWSGATSQNTLHWSMGLSLGASAALLLLLLSPLWGIATKTVLAALVTHLAPSPL